MSKDCKGQAKLEDAQYRAQYAVCSMKRMCSMQYAIRSMCSALCRIEYDAVCIRCAVCSMQSVMDNLDWMQNNKGWNLHKRLELISIVTPCKLLSKTLERFDKQTNKQHCKCVATLKMSRMSRRKFWRIPGNVLRW